MAVSSQAIAKKAYIDRTDSTPGTHRPRRGAPRRWSMELQVGQLLALWVVISVAMFLVFYFGLQTGRKQGIEYAFERRDNEVLRLPVERMVQNLGEVSDPLAKTPSAQQNMGRNMEESSPPGAELNNASAGFAQKNALSVLSNNAKASDTAATLEKSPSEKPPTASGATPAALGPVAPVETKVVPPVAKVEKPKTQKTQAPSTLTGATGWYIQIAATNTDKEADSLIRKLKNRSLPTTVQKTKIRNASYSRILVGPFKTRAGALEAQRKVSSSKITEGETFLRYIS